MCYTRNSHKNWPTGRQTPDWSADGAAAWRSICQDKAWTRNGEGKKHD